MMYEGSPPASWYEPPDFPDTPDDLRETCMECGTAYARAWQCEEDDRIGERRVERVLVWFNTCEECGSMSIWEDA